MCCALMAVNKPWERSGLTQRDCHKKSGLLWTICENFVGCDSSPRSKWAKCCVCAREASCVAVCFVGGTIQLQNGNVAARKRGNSQGSELVGRVQCSNGSSIIHCVCHCVLLCSTWEHRQGKRLWITKPSSENLVPFCSEVALQVDDKDSSVSPGRPAEQTRSTTHVGHSKILRIISTAAFEMHVCSVHGSFWNDGVDVNPHEVLCGTTQTVKLAVS